MFDVNNIDHVIKLRDEELLDPDSMGYSTVSGITVKTLDLFNNADNNVLDDSGQYIGEVFTSEVAIDVIEPDEITVGAKFSEGKSRWLGFLFSASESLGDNFSLFETKFRSLFVGYTPSSVTLNALDARNRKLSRVEFLFGKNSVISKTDWYTTRDYIGA